MEISSSSANNYLSASLNPLKAANEQPKLALQLILATVEANSLPSGNTPAQPPPPVSGKGQHINITA